VIVFQDVLAVVMGFVITLAVDHVKEVVKEAAQGLVIQLAQEVAMEVAPHHVVVIVLVLHPVDAVGARILVVQIVLVRVVLVLVLVLGIVLVGVEAPPLIVLVVFVRIHAPVHHLN